MKRILTMDEVRIGMYITVLRGKMEQKVFPTPNGPQVMSREKDHYNGKVLEVLSIDLPYIIVAIHGNLGSRNDSLDLRHVEVMQLDPGYVNKLVPKLKIQEDSFWEGVKNDSIEGCDETLKEIFKGMEKK